MKVDTFISDAHELTLYLLKEFHKEKILVVGHSWGTLLGLRFVQEYPQLVHAYVGSGQVVNQAVAERISFEYIKSKSAGNGRALEELASIDAPLPYLTIPGDERWFDKLKTHRKWLVKTGGEFYEKGDYSTFVNMRTLLAPEYSLLDYLRFGLGSNFSLRLMWPEVMETNFVQPTASVKVPVFFLQGRHDFVTPSSLVLDLFEKIQAPEKQLIWFDRSGHHPMYEEPGRYDDILIGMIRPICQ
jgi:pimeloyl-ACP methyl ester carboxylesterase